MHANDQSHQHQPSSSLSAAETDQIVEQSTHARDQQARHDLVAVQHARAVGALELAAAGLNAEPPAPAQQTPGLDQGLDDLGL